MKQARLEELLKHKGIGPKGSKSLRPEQLGELQEILTSNEVSLTTKASFFTAFSLLENTPEESLWFEKNQELFPVEVLNLTKATDQLEGLVARVLKRENLSYEDSRKALAWILDETVDDYIKGAFLEAERLKRETFDENLGFLDELWNHSKRIETNLPIVIDLADNYDGFNRTYCYAPFLAATLAACGYPTLIHGAKTAAPKFGWTSHQVLEEAKKNVKLTLEESRTQLENIEIGWSYLDESIFYPQMHKLHSMRKEMVKRPMLATFEKLMQPIRSVNGNYQALGYTHTAYRELLANLLVSFAKSPKAMVVRGVEGTSRPSLARKSIVMYYDGKESHEEHFLPEEFGIESREEPLDKTITPQQNLEVGIEVLQGKPSVHRDVLLYWGCAVLSGFRFLTDEEARQKLEKAIDSGRALHHFNAFVDA